MTYCLAIAIDNGLVFASGLSSGQRAMAQLFVAFSATRSVFDTGEFIHQLSATLIEPVTAGTE